MLSKLKKSNNKGFTIIEVMIVLAIAGLILLIVLLAVPALQRSARNTQRKNDTSSIASAISNSINDNGGVVPTALGKDSDTSTLDICSAGGGATGGATACTGSTETAKLGYYTPGNVFLEANKAAAPTLATTGAVSATNITTEEVVIDTGYTCGTTAGTIGGVSSRSAAIFYATEGGSGGSGNLNCIEQ